MGSAGKVEYHLLPARELKLLPEVDYRRLAADATGIKRMLTSLIKKEKAEMS